MAGAPQPRVEFDLGYLVECHDVTARGFALSHPDEKVVEADLQISVRLAQGEERDLEQLLFEITSPAGRLRVVDFLPKTQIETEMDGGIEVTKTTETTRTFGATAGSGFSLSTAADHPHSITTAGILPSANANASTTHRNELKETSKKTPPGTAVVVSGTMDNEHGVFFKLKRSTKGSFEGTKVVSFRFVVPADWRGDWVVVSAQARGMVKRSLFFKSVEPCGETKAFVGLHLAGDAEAERAASDLAESQALYWAGAGVKEQPAAQIAELALAARPWQTAKSQTAAKQPLAATLRTCHKPFAQVLFGSDENAHRAAHGQGANDRTADLKESLDRLAKLAHAG
ncbi:MAG TPA: hypothetical protein VGX78_18810 [Pirellulales bacterium]|nr:hypothetical protein [Pirellulales bacterium]